MLIKPYLKKVKPVPIGTGTAKAAIELGLSRVNSLPSEVEKPLNSSFLWWEEVERKEFLESEGRLLILAILSKERSLKNNKTLHDVGRVFDCIVTWPICQCQFSRLIRGFDIGFSIEQIDKLGEII